MSMKEVTMEDIKECIIENWCKKFNISMEEACNDILKRYQDKYQRKCSNL